MWTLTEHRSVSNGISLPAASVISLCTTLSGVWPPKVPVGFSADIESSDHHFRSWAMPVSDLQGVREGLDHALSNGLSGGDFAPYGFRFKDNNGKIIENFDSDADYGTGLAILKTLRQKQAVNIAVYTSHNIGAGNPLPMKMKITAIQKAVEEALGRLGNNYSFNFLLKYYFLVANDLMWTVIRIWGLHMVPQVGVTGGIAQLLSKVFCGIQLLVQAWDSCLWCYRHILDGIALDISGVINICQFEALCPAFSVVYVLLFWPSDAGIRMSKHQQIEPLLSEFTLWGRMMHVGVSKLDRRCFGEWLDECSAGSLCLNQHGILIVPFETNFGIKIKIEHNFLAKSNFKMSAKEDILFRTQWVNLFRLNDAYVRQCTIISLVQMVACRLRGARPLLEPMLTS